MANKNILMPLPPVLAQWLAMVTSNSEIIICPENINHEACANMWAFSPTEAETQEIDNEGLKQFLLEVIKHHKKLVQASGAAMLFYCWHDGLCRQLRFSMVSATHNSLPFACEIHQTDNLDQICTRITNADWLVKNNMCQTNSTENQHLGVDVFTVLMP